MDYWICVICYHTQTYRKNIWTDTGNSNQNVNLYQSIGNRTAKFKSNLQYGQEFQVTTMWLAQSQTSLWQKFEIGSFYFHNCSGTVVNQKARMSIIISNTSF